MTLAPLFPIAKDTYLFGSAYGYRDNAKYLFEQATSAGIENCCWVAHTREEYDLVTKKGLAVVRTGTVTWLSFVARANVAFFTHGIGDIAPSLPAKTITVNLWHGFPMKRMGYDSPRDLARLNWRRRFLVGDEYRKWDFMIASNQISLRALMSATRLPRKKFLLAKQPRNADLNACCNDHPERFALYMPTFRESGRLSHIHQIISWWEEVYARTGIKLCVNLHPEDFARGDFDGLKREWLLEPVELRAADDPQKLMVMSHYLISDYSSVVFDYFLTSRRVIFYTPDMDSYMTAMGGGFYVDYSELIENCLQANSAEDFVECLTTNFRYSKQFLEKYGEQDDINLIDRFLR